jgi:hypothetical protein
MIVFSEHSSPRLNYILEYIFAERLGIPFQVTQSWDDFLKSTEPKVNYSHQTLSGSVTLIPEGLLFEKNVRKKKPPVTYNNGIPIIFRKLGDADLKFDIFAAIFYFISRYEEYQPYETDLHERFPAKESLAFKNIFLNQPVVDYWILLLKQELIDKYPELVFKAEKFKAIPTIDIDSPWCFRHKGMLRNTGGFLRDLLNFQIKFAFIRIAVLLRILPDPWFVFDWIKEVFRETNQQAILFVHVGKHGRYDKSVNSKNPFFKRAIRELGKEFQIGLHPSYTAANKPLLIKKELIILRKISEQCITISRQHFLKIKLPEYYRLLVDIGITDDYSMGFADKAGFRAGTSRPFLWYDLNQEEVTPLRVHPFAAMDRTVHTHEEKIEAAAQLVYNELLEQVRLVDGLFVTLWHNESFNNYFEWKGWKGLFENVMHQTARVKND